MAQAPKGSAIRNKTSKEARAHAKEAKVKTAPEATATAASRQSDHPVTTRTQKGVSK